MQLSPSLLDLPPATGVFDDIRLEGGALTAWGWLLAPDSALNRIRVLLDGRVAGFAERIRRPDVLSVYGWIPHAGESGFSIQREWRQAQGRIDLIGESAEGSACRLGTFFCSDLDRRVPTPPTRLMRRTARVFGQAFKFQGQKIFTDFMDRITRFSAPQPTWRVLDWGCGCGRVTAHFVEHLAGDVVGADLDPEAISWCRETFPQASFDVVASRPPLPYGEGIFDAVTACSVFTHLSREDQEDWLQEMRRVVKPGGLLLASTHGQFAYRQRLFCKEKKRFSWVRPRRRNAILNGLRDCGSDPALGAAAPRGYYRTIYQSRDYTLNAWSRWFEIVDYIERGVDGFQDLVVMRRPQ